MLMRLCGIIAVLAFVSAVPASAQVPGVGFEFAPYGGVVIPATDLVDEATLVRSHKTAFALGARLTIAIPGPLAIEGGLLYAFSDVEETSGGSTTDVDANVWALSGTLVFDFSLPAAPISFYLRGGAAYISRTGDAYDGWDKTGDIGGIVGAGMKVGLPGILKIRVDAESYIYSAALVDAGAASLGSQFQADIVLSAGLVFSFM